MNCCLERRDIDYFTIIDINCSGRCLSTVSSAAFHAYMRLADEYQIYITPLLRPLVLVESVLVSLYLDLAIQPGMKNENSSPALRTFNNNNISYIFIAGIL